MDRLQIHCFIHWLQASTLLTVPITGIHFIQGILDYFIYWLQVIDFIHWSQTPTFFHYLHVYITLFCSHFIYQLPITGIHFIHWLLITGIHFIYWLPITGIHFIYWLPISGIYFIHWSQTPTFSFFTCLHYFILHPLYLPITYYRHPLYSLITDYRHPLYLLITYYRHPLYLLITYYRHPLYLLITYYRHPLYFVVVCAIKYSKSWMNILSIWNSTLQKMSFVTRSGIKHWIRKWIMIPHGKTIQKKNLLYKVQ